MVVIKKSLAVLTLLTVYVGTYTYFVSFCGCKICSCVGFVWLVFLGLHGDNDFSMIRLVPLGYRSGFGSLLGVVFASHSEFHGC